MEALREDKLKNHHTNPGTLRCTEALAERKRACRELGLLRKEDEHLVCSLIEPLPLACEALQQSDNGDDDLCIAPRTPSYNPQQDSEGDDYCCPPSPWTEIREAPLPGVDSRDETSSHIPVIASGTTLPTSVDDCALSDQLLRAHSTKRRKTRPPNSQEHTKRQRNTLRKYLVLLNSKKTKTK
ncbi:hypothetical protein OS493_019600 [Desmophyllum pertusum]|uniref:Uncharacterized protein n=1 Tax=Desmophyllum pertusum TaxID=174260 RepID=A0A9W9ZCE2_9CNID|nr:hypothetical protein OS493_019600 [Desmophyllum pertusum]